MAQNPQGTQNISLTTAEWPVECKSSLDPDTLKSLMQNPQLHEIVGEALTEAVRKFAQQKGHPDNHLELTLNGPPQNVQNHGNGGQQRQGQGQGQGQGYGRGGSGGSAA